MLTPTLQALRQDYKKAVFNETDAAKSPFVQFERWFAEAQSALIHEPNAMTIATANASGQPSARIVLLKGFSEEGFIFYTNYNSQKGQNIQENPKAALLFLWHDLERQVRIEGKVEKISRELSEAYFHSRPKGSQISALVSAQSSITDRAELEKAWVAAEQKYANEEVPLPDFWGGYIVKPTYFEFWQGRSSRLHDRLAYSTQNEDWKIERLAP